MNNEDLLFDFYVCIRVNLDNQADLEEMGNLELRDKWVLQEAVVVLDHQDQWAALDHLE